MAERRVFQLNDIPTWKQLYATDSKSLEKMRPDVNFSNTLFTGGFPPFKPDDEINTKVSIFEGDITDLEIDGIVNAANSSLLGGGGVDGAIHRAAGSQLLEECRTLCGCQTGDAKTTCGYKLPARYVVHTVGPQGNFPKDLRSCYGRCLEEMLAHNMRTLAFPCISTGIYGYPNELAVHVALNTVREWFDEMKKKDQLHLVNRIVFCLHDKEDVVEYRTWIEAYFPVPDSDKAKDSKEEQVNAVKKPANLKKSIDKTVVRLLLPDSMIGVIIGNRGEDLKRLKTDYSAAVHLADNRSPDRILTICGSVDEICDVFLDIAMTISRELNNEDEEGNLEMRLLLNRTYADYMNKNPSTLVNLMMRTGSGVILYSDYAPYSTERVVQISGSTSQTTACVRSVLSTLKKVSSNGVNVKYHPNNFDRVHATAYGGYTDDGDSRGIGLSGVSSSMSDDTDEGRISTTEVFIHREAAGSYQDENARHVGLIEQASGSTVALKYFRTGQYKLIVTGTLGQRKYAHYLLHMQLLRYAGKTDVSRN